MPKNTESQSLKKEKKNPTDITGGNIEINEKYNLSKLQIFSVDGVFARVDNGEGRLLFYNNAPIVSCGKSETQKITNCLVELRMNQNNFRKIAQIIVETIMNEDQEFLKLNNMENTDNTSHEEMFA